MGNYTSKLFSHHNEAEAKPKISNNGASRSIEKIKLCTPPITKRKLTTDPRSATMGITRTPIEVSCTPPGLTRRVASALPKYLQGKRYLETDFDTVMPIGTPDKCLPDPRSPNVCQQRTPILVKSESNYLSPVVIVKEIPEMETPIGVRPIFCTLDPRSPATDFDRTPILKPRSAERTSNSEENLEVKTESNVRLSYCETTTNFNIPEIQAISEILPVETESLSLESDREVCEAMENSGTSLDRSVSDDSSMEEQVTVIRNPNILTKYSDDVSAWTEETSQREDNEVAKTMEELDESNVKTFDADVSEITNSQTKLMLDEPKRTSNEKIKVWRDSVSPVITDETKNFDKLSEEIMIEFDDETKCTNIINPSKVTSKVDDEKLKSQVKKRKGQIKGENKTEEKKIFNDGKVTMDVNRTPLGNRSNNHEKRQLPVGKSPQQLFRNKGLSARTTQQENTPPTERFVSKIKPNGIQWDADTTVII